MQCLEGDDGALVREMSFDVNNGARGVIK